MKLFSCLFLRILDYPGEILRIIDQKIGLEIFKLGLVFSTVYFVQGMGGLSSIPLLFYFKDVLHFNEAQLQYFGAIAGIAWLIKPLFGFISDRFPIFGYRRKSYMILMALVAACSWWLLAWMVANNYNQYGYLVLVFNFSALGYAFVDVVCDALMVQRGQALKMEKVFVNIQWFSIGIAGFIAGFLSGQFQEWIKQGAIPLPLVFIIVGIIPILTSVIAWFCVEEKRIEKATRRAIAGQNTIQQNETQQRLDFAAIKEVVCSKTFWILSAFIFFWNYTPSFGAVFQYYEIDILKFDPLFLGKIGAVGNAIFPLSIMLYVGLLKRLPQIKTRHYLYASITLGLISAAISWLFYLPEETFNWISFSLPYGDKIIIVWLMPSLVFLFALHLLFRNKNNYLAKLRFFVTWTIILVLSLLISLWFCGLTFTPFVLSYRSLIITTGIIFGYLSIASFLIPLSLAAELAPEKAEGMTYAYFMALSNISRGFLPSISGAWMFEVLKKTFDHPETIVKTIMPDLLTSLALLGIIGLVIALAILTVAVIKSYFLAENAYRALILRYSVLISVAIVIKRIKDLKSIAVFAIIFSFFAILIFQIAAGVFGKLSYLANIPVYLVQKSYFALQPIIGNADFLAENAYRALILRYSVLISVAFIIFSILFVYLLPPDKERQQPQKKERG